MSEPRQPDSAATGAYEPTPAGPSERFAPGVVLASRYRIVAALGKGGMGEVWRADDLTLGQPVALKFLPPHLTADDDRLARFRKEVAVARRVSHPNCCRVYDLGDDSGRPFLTMEFIDGEDLASVLRRFGRLPEERAVEVARELCQALQAVHDQGLLHRDLKPANVMLDGRGKVRLTDFGLAAVAADLSATEVRAGTPAYMAPEQLAGTGVSERTDLFALGLVLYELFTGKKAFPGTDRDTPPSKPSGHVSGLDPTVERVLLHCLEPDPAARPRSALAVAAALPGGDPLAAALAAGETPSPRVVADAGGEGVIRPWVGLTLVVAIVACLLLCAVTADRVMLFRKVPLPEPPAVLARRARQILEHCGHPNPPADVAYHFRVNAEVLKRIAADDPSPGRWDDLGAVRPTPIYFFYRQSPRSLDPTVTDTAELEYVLVTDDNPPPVRPGMAGVHLDPMGHLLRFYAVPPQQSDAPPTPEKPDWHRWFDRQTVGFELAELDKADPVWTPPCACDRQAAWTGTLPGRPDWPVRVEAAAYRGLPVYFEIMPLTRQGVDAPLRGFFRPRNAFFGTPVLGPILVTGVFLLAVRNLRRGRSDVHGAVRLGLAIVGVMTIAWLLGGHHSFGQLPLQFSLVLGGCVALAGLYGLSYLALEPAVRRRWPWRLTAWNRLLDGRLTDPMVGRDLLVGLAFGSAALLIRRLGRLSADWLVVPPPMPLTGTGPPALNIPGPPTSLYVLLSFLLVPVVIPVLYLLVSFICFLVVRREWLTWVGVFCVFLLMFAIPLRAADPTGYALPLTWIGLFVAVQLVGLARFGLLTMSGSLLFSELVSLAPLTSDLSAWYAWQGVLMASVMVGLAVYAFVIATRRQRLFREGFFGDD